MLVINVWTEYTRSPVIQHYQELRDIYKGHYDDIIVNKSYYYQNFVQI